MNRILLVGVGRWGEKHLRVLRAMGAAVWVAEVDPARRAWAVARGVPAERVVEDYRAALAAVDAVDVVTPAQSHGEVATAALRAGRHCFVEKPLAVTAGEGRRLAALARETARVLQVSHVFRFHPVTAAVGEALDAGRIGRVRFATGRFSGFKRPRVDVGVTHSDAIHYFDLFAHLLRRPATSVAALQADYLGRGLDDMSLTVVTYDGVPVTVEANYFVPGAWRECVIVGERGSLVADYGAGVATLYQGAHRRRGGTWEAVDEGKEALAVGTDEPLALALDAFRAACVGRRGNPVPPEEAVAALEIVEAAALSARVGRTVRLDEIRSGPEAAGAP